MAIRDNTDLININSQNIPDIEITKITNDPILDNYFNQVNTSQKLAEQQIADTQRALQQQAEEQQRNYLNRQKQEFDIFKQQTEYADLQAQKQAQFEYRKQQDAERARIQQERIDSVKAAQEYTRKQKEKENRIKELQVSLPSEVETTINDYLKKTGFNQYSSDKRTELLPNVAQDLEGWVQQLPKEYHSSARDLIKRNLTKNINARKTEEETGDGVGSFLVKASAAIGSTAMDAIDLGLGVVGQATGALTEQGILPKGVVKGVVATQKFTNSIRKGGSDYLDSTKFYRYDNQRNKEIEQKLLSQYGAKSKEDLKDPYTRGEFEVRNFLSAAANDPSSQIAQAVPYLTFALIRGAKTALAVNSLATGGDVFSTSSENIKNSTHEELMNNPDYRYALGLFDGDKESAKQYLSNKNAGYSSIIGGVLGAGGFLLGGASKAGQEIGKALFRKGAVETATKEVGASIINPVAKRSLFGTVKGVASGVGGVAKTAVVEGGEEALTTLGANQLSINRGASNNLLDNVASSGVGGALQGGAIKGLGVGVKAGTDYQQNKEITNKLAKIDTVVDTLQNIPQDQFKTQADSILATNWFKNLSPDERITYLSKVDQKYGYVPNLDNTQAEPLNVELKNTIDAEQENIVKNAKPVATNTDTQQELKNLTTTDGVVDAVAFNKAIIKNDVDNLVNIINKPSNTINLEDSLNNYYKSLDEKNISPEMRLLTEEYINDKYGIENLPDSPSITIPNELEVSNSLLEKQNTQYLKDSRTIKDLLKTKNDFEAQLETETNPSVQASLQDSLSELNNDLENRIVNLEELSKELEITKEYVGKAKEALASFAEKKNTQGQAIPSITQKIELPVGTIKKSISERIANITTNTSVKDNAFVAARNKDFQNLPLRKKITEAVFNPNNFGTYNAKESNPSVLKEKISKSFKDTAERELVRKRRLENIRTTKDFKETLSQGNTTSFGNDGGRSFEALSKRTTAEKNPSSRSFKLEKTATTGVSANVENVIDSQPDIEAQRVETTPFTAYDSPQAKPEVLNVNTDNEVEITKQSPELSKYLQLQKKVREGKYQNTRDNLDYLLALGDEIDAIRDDTDYDLNKQLEKAIKSVGGEGIEKTKKTIERERLNKEVSYNKAKEIIDINTERANNLEKDVKELEQIIKDNEELSKKENIDSVKKELAELKKQEKVEKKDNKELISKKEEELKYLKELQEKTKKDTEKVKKDLEEIKTLRESIKDNEVNVGLLKQDIDNLNKQAHNNEIYQNHASLVEAMPEAIKDGNKIKNIYNQSSESLKRVARGGISDIALALRQAGVSKTGTSDRSYVLTNLMASKSDKARALISKLQESIGDPLDSNIRSLMVDLKLNNNTKDLTFTELSLDVGELYSLKHIQETLAYYANKKQETKTKLEALKKEEKTAEKVVEIDKLTKQYSRENLLSTKAGGKTLGDVELALKDFANKYNDLNIFENIFKKISDGNKKLLDMRLKNNNITQKQYDLINTANYKYYTPFRPDVSINAPLSVFTSEATKQREDILQYPARNARGMDALFTDQRTGGEEAGNAYTNLYISLENVGKSLVEQQVYDEIINLYDKKYQAPDDKGKPRLLVDKVDLDSEISVEKQIAKVASELNRDPQDVVTIRKPKLDETGDVVRDEYGSPVFDIYYLNHPNLSTGFLRFENANAKKSGILIDTIDYLGRFITVGRTVFSPAFTVIDSYKNLQTDFLNLFTKDLIDTSNNKIKPSIVAKNYAKSTKEVLKAYPEFFKYFNSKDYKSNNEMVKLFNQLVDDGFYTSFSEDVGVRNKDDILLSRDKKTSTRLGRLFTKKQIADDKATDTGITVDRKGALYDKIRAADSMLAFTLDKSADLYLNSYVEYGNLISKVAAYKALLDSGVERQEAGAITRRLYDPQNTSLGTNKMARIFPFLRSAMAGADNTVQAITTKRGAMSLIALTAINGALLVPVLGAMFEDELGKFSILDLFKGIPFRADDSKTGGKTANILPIGSGLPKLAWAFSLFPELIKHHHESTVLDAYKDLILQEFAALPNFSSQNTMLENLTVGIFPIFAKPLVRVAINKNAFGGEIYNKTLNVGEYNYQNGKTETPQGYKDMAKYLGELTNGIVDIPPEVVRSLMQEYAVGALSYFYHANEKYDESTAGTRVSKADQLGAATLALGIGSAYTMAEQAKAEAFYSTKESADKILKNNKVEYSVKGTTEKFEERIKRIGSQLSDNNASERDINIVIDYLTAKNKLDSLNRKITEIKNKNIENIDDERVQIELEQAYNERLTLLEQAGNEGLENVASE